ncbi:MAG: hypothetical protein KBC30_02805 [Planctomycetes bacterium]|nr:hypothetical protein [Planctomycetota bacterium]HPY75875.1 hypothetical protein [Planctomycetota bacterium]HQB01066.1 hypothetical protein [Planctomycetota bacterium]
MKKNLRKYQPWNSWISWIVCIICLRMGIAFFLKAPPTPQETYMNAILELTQQETSQETKNLIHSILLNMMNQSQKNRTYITTWLKEHHQIIPVENPFHNLEKITLQLKPSPRKTYQLMTQIISIIFYSFIILSILLIYKIAGKQALSAFLQLPFRYIFIIYIFIPLLSLTFYFSFSIFPHITLSCITLLYLYQTHKTKALTYLLRIPSKKIILIYCILLLPIFYPYVPQKKADSISFDKIQNVLQQIQKQPSAEAIPHILQILHTKTLPNNIRIQALQILSEQATADILPNLLPYLQDKNLQKETLQTIHDILQKKK